MTQARRKAKRGRQPSTPEERTALVAAFERSGDSAATFAREHGIAYSTFCSWRRQQAADVPSPGFVEVALDGPTTPVGLVVEVGSRMRLHVRAPDQVELAAQLIRALEGTEPC
ncbi:MAG: transposase [Verrucomicrobiales bacterium]|nr:transposase [Planctomycetota bacterium]MCP5523589.1 transposase [Verrucomicrobiales bacterium]